MSWLKTLLPILLAGVVKAIMEIFAKRKADENTAKVAVQEEEIKTAEATAEIADEQAKSNAKPRGGARGVAERLRERKQASGASGEGPVVANVSPKNSSPVPDSDIGSGGDSDT